MPGANGKPTYTEAQMDAALATREHTLEIGHLKDSSVRLERAVERNLEVVTTSIAGFTTKLDSIVTAQSVCEQKHLEAAAERGRLWNLIKVQWGATGLGSIVAAIIGKFG